MAVSHICKAGSATQVIEEHTCYFFGVCVVSGGSESWVKEKLTQEKVKYTADTI